MAVLDDVHRALLPPVDFNAPIPPDPHHAVRKRLMDAREVLSREWYPAEWEYLDS
jgi:hypothetical protein